MSQFIPRVPSANRFNRDTFAAAWMYAYGGTWQNAVSAWRVDCLEALKRRLADDPHYIQLLKDVPVDINLMIGEKAYERTR